MNQEKNTGAEAVKAGSAMDTIEKMHVVAAWLDDKQALDIVALDVSGICAIAEGLVICSAKSVRHAQALADHMLKSAKDNGIEYLGMEGYKGGGWVLIDLNDVLVHVFKEETRQFYNLEGLWSEADQLELVFDQSEPGEQQEGA